MPYPVILVNSSTGSDTAASGAGPSTALTGSKARTRDEANSIQVGLFEDTPPDLTDVLTDGSHVIFVDTSNRAFGRIVGKKDTQQTGTAASATSGNNQITLDSTTGISAEDVIKVEGAGTAGADLYARISAVNSSTLVTIYGTVGTTVTAANWVCPKKVTIQVGLNTGTSDCTWAIGGKRATIDNTNTRKLFNNSGGGDMQSGWIVEIEDNQTVTSTITVYRNGGATLDTQVLIRGADPNNRPIITCTANTITFDQIAGYSNQRFENLELRNTNSTKTASYAFQIRAVTVIDNCKIGHSGEGFYQGITITSNSQSLRIMNSEICYNANHGATTGTGTCTINSYNCYYHHNGGFGIYINFGIVTNCIVAYNGSYGIYYHTASPNISTSIITHNSSHGVVTAALQYVPSLLNNQFTYNGGYGVVFGVAQTGDNLVENNNTYGNSSGGFGNITTSSSNLTLDPMYVDDVNFNFTINNPLLLGAGWPDYTKPGMLTPNNPDIGFQAPHLTAEEIAEAVWDYGERTLTS